MAMIKADPFPFLAKCHRCRQPIERTPKRAEPVVCGPCHHRIKEDAGVRAVQSYHERMRAEVA